MYFMEMLIFVWARVPALVLYSHVIDLPQQRARAHVRGDNCPVAPPPLWATYIS